MKFRDYFFTYSWSDLRPIHELRDTWVKTYLMFGVAGLFLVKSDSFTKAFVVPAAFGFYPAFLIGAWWQAKQRPAALVENELMVKRVRFLSWIGSFVGSLFLAKFFLHV